MSILKESIKTISFPNTAKDSEQSSYSVFKKGLGGCKEIRKIFKDEKDTWSQIILDDDSVLAEIKESVCDIFYQ